MTLQLLMMVAPRCEANVCRVYDLQYMLCVFISNQVSNGAGTDMIVARFSVSKGFRMSWMRSASALINRVCFIIIDAGQYNVHDRLI